jgi:ubiquinone/menaquinone biosynthesis C-methylase UbiE
MSSPELEWVDLLYESTYFRFLKDKNISHDEFWTNFGIYDEIVKHSSYPGNIYNRICDLIVPGKKIIDIGAGTGAFTIPLAGIASEVIAIDPSSYHLEILASKCADGCIHNVNFINEEWKHVDEEKYAQALRDVDYTIAAYSIIDPDIESFLKKMYCVSTKGMFIVYRTGERDPLEEFAHGKKRSIDYQYILRVMEEMGLDASVEILQRDYWLPLDLVMRKFKECKRSGSELYNFICESERLDTSSGESKVSFSTKDALIYIFKNRF